MDIKVLGSSSSGNCYILTDSKGKSLILEAGVRFSEVEKALNYNLSGVIACCITHQHSDHAQYINEYKRRYIRTIMPDCMITESSSRCTPATGSISITDYTIHAFPAYHDVPCVFYIIHHPESGFVLFATDTTHLPKFDVNITTALIEANYEADIILHNYHNNVISLSQIDRVIDSHMSLERCITELHRLNSASLKRVILLHLSNANSNASHSLSVVEKKIGKPCWIADRGLTLNIDK